MEAIEEQPQTRRLWWSGLAGVVGGLLWAVIGWLRLAPPEPFTREDIGRVTPLAAMLLLVGLAGVHALHRGRAGRWERWGYAIAAAGLSLSIFGLILERWLIGEPPSGGDVPPEVVLPRLLYLVGLVVQGLGMLGVGVGTLRARVLPIWARPLPLLTVLAVLPAGVFTQAQALDGLVWAALGLGVLATPAPLEEPSERVTLREARAAFLSRATVISGVLAIGVWSLEWSWIVGVLVVLLLYGHEIGHVLAAFWRGVEVKRAPLFLPGLGAFVETAPGASAWDEAWTSLGGPLFGGACALVVKLVGIRNGSPELAHAGDFALLVNLLNLAPFSPLDGGHVARKTGWLGVLLTLGLGIFLLVQGIGLFLSALVILSGIQALATVRQTGARFGTHVGIFGLYLGSVVVLLLAFYGSGQVTWLTSTRPAWMPSLGTLFEIVFWVYIAGLFVLPYAWRPEQTGLVRYGLAALVGWPRYLLNRQLWMIPVTFFGLAQALGLAGAEWLRRYGLRLVRNGDPSGGAVLAYGFDALVRSGSRSADGWLEGVSGTVRSSGTEVVQSACATLLQLGYSTTARQVLGCQVVEEVDNTETPELVGA